MRKNYRGGFALPTVLISSVVMLIVLSVSVSSVVAVRTSLKVQYYEQLAKVAGESGVAFAKACLSKNANVPLWTDDKPLTPATDCAGNVLLGPSVQVLVVGGGGGGGAGIGGGGGGGGVRQEDSIPVSTNGSYGIVVGAGGAGGPSLSGGSTGGASSFSSYVVGGGGGGGGRASGTSYSAAKAGASGGGGNGTYESTTGSGALGANGDGEQGNDGGAGSAASVSPFAGNGGGGGGAGSPGGDAEGTASTEGTSGVGGNGLLSDITGQQLYYGPGGSGGRYGVGTVGVPGLTGGGTGGSGTAIAGTAGQANLGAGGGGGSSGDGLGGAGGSGIVVVRYATGSITPSSATSANTQSTYGPYTIHRFKASGNFVVASVGTATCPSDPKCSVTVNGNLRSSFRVKKPAVDANGKAISIPNNGYVELLRASNGQVWRTYQQPATQVAAVPDLCSGAASSQLGWSNAIVAPTQSTLPNITSARSISVADQVDAGRTYFRKDFAVTEAGSYNIVAQTPSSADYVEIYLTPQASTSGIGTRYSTAQGTTTNNTASLAVGCYTITARLTNKTLLPRNSQFTAAVQKISSTEALVYTDTSWRTTTGSSVHFSESDFYSDPAIWTKVTDNASAISGASTWGTASGDAFTRLIAASCNTSCPPASSTYFRDDKDFLLSANTDVLVSALCDDDCTVYVDGSPVIASSPWSNINQQTLTMTKGSHHVGVRLTNGGSAANPSRFALTMIDKSTGTVLTRSDINWTNSNNIWVDANNSDLPDPTSYEYSFRPSPSEIVDPVVADILVVGGGAGGASNAAGGGGGGGVQYFRDVPMTVGSKAIIVGAGGAGAAINVAPVNGGLSQFTTSYQALGGGKGAPRTNTVSTTLLAASPAIGTTATGGGGAGATSAYNNSAAGIGTLPQGGNGGAGTAPDGGSTNSRGGGGGGAGGGGFPGVLSSDAGAGGPGYISYIVGSRQLFGSGGGGAGTTGGVSYGAVDGVATSTNAMAGPANTGRGGSGSTGSTVSGGAGGSGTVIIRFKAGSMTLHSNSSIGATITDVTIKGVAYKVYEYKNAGNSVFWPTILTP